ncbi:MAG: ABC transporter substrate-binding protein, partial [Candidatus Parcubacteria bacterium]|nr:ABC transporter substrate-binding protein [Candidatus Parcubacteria bacterium]
KPIGSGPWRFKKLTRNAQGDIRSYVLERNEKFYDPRPYLSKITFQFYKNFNELTLAAQKRQISGISYAPAQVEEQLISGGVLKKYSLPLPHYTAIFFNVQNNKALNSKIVRQALSYAVPRDKIINEVLFGEGQIIQGPILPSAPYYTSSLTQYNYDPAKAAKLLENTGWKKGDDGFWHQGGQTLEITLTTVQQPDMEQIGQIIQSAWEDLGIKTKLLSVPPDMMQSEIITPHNYQALLFGIVQSFNADPSLLWHSGSSLNLSLYSNKRVDDLLDKAPISPFEDIKNKKYVEFQQIVNDELPAIFLYTDSYAYLVDKNIKGINVEKINAPSDRLNGIKGWYIYTKNVAKKSEPATKK